MGSILLGFNSSVYQLVWFSGQQDRIWDNCWYFRTVPNFGPLHWPPTFIHFLLCFWLLSDFIWTGQLRDDGKQGNDMQQRAKSPIQALSRSTNQDTPLYFWTERTDNLFSIFIDMKMTDWSFFFLLGNNYTEIVQPPLSMQYVHTVGSTINTHRLTKTTHCYSFSHCHYHNVCMSIDK